LAFGIQNNFERFITLGISITFLKSKYKKVICMYRFTYSFIYRGDKIGQFNLCLPIPFLVRQKTG